MSDSIAHRLAATGGRTAGFDYLRIGLSMSILLWHSIAVSYGSAYELTIWRGPLGWVMHAVLPMFFALSGFLVTGSLERCPTLISYFGLRVLRIVPALGVEVLISALIFGPLLSSMGVLDYFSHPQLHAYFLNLFGDIHYLLPGVFEHNPVPLTVNAQLWTIPYELQCYAALGALAIAGVVKWPKLLLVVAVVGQALWAWEAIRRGDNGGSGGASGAILVISFLVGMVFYVYRHKIYLNRWIFLFCLVGGLFLSALPHGAYYLPFPATYVTIYIGLLNPPRLRYVFNGDYSYGIYLYGFSIQQAFATGGPWTHHWYTNLLVCVPVCVFVAVCSWHFVEKPMLKLRRHVSTVEKRLIAVLFAPPAQIVRS